MHNLPFFIGSGKLTIWYILFYLLALPVYLFGLFLFSQLHQGQGPQGGEFVLSVLAIGYLILGFFSMINAMMYIQATRKYFWGSFLFLGSQVLFWILGYAMGNNYPLLFVLFLLFLLFTIYCNLLALWHFQHKKYTPHISSKKK